ncbi:ABC transporter permease [Enemella evansiae]|uniref:ABC transporter permease n=1 Tax=Enemella evansiae TaxID=2016499 RepID=A0A255GCF8_9ACTN|nr:ABC transporter permease [Enemella evansiae]PFG68239.1 peptide/nickel transport system permease protein [Propionibacteriaceae bacterium ES.041]OYO01014.1 ABC transporter permease [Enemella evansiae]OYO03807.1 ABC transporter permease [Enemella evansiae]OYO10406.1 ABC transporter permease [Enemella evansiae]OYO13580.1 ABC transporter permease [Enemella evansiae]
MSLAETSDPSALEDVPAPAGLGRYVLNRAIGAAISLILIVVVGFFVFRILPGDPAITMTRGRRVSAADVDRLREQFGLDQPLPVQFWKYLTGLVTGDLGTSYTYDAPVTQLIGERVGSTLLLTGTAAAISVVLGLWLGQRVAWRRGSTFDKAQTGIALVFWSVPTFWLGLLLLMLFGGTLQWFPTGGMTTPGSTATGLAYALDVARHLVLPVLTMVAVVYAQYLMVMRASVLEEMNADYLTTARAKGLREDLVRTRHAVPNALLPTVTLIFLTLGHLIGGAITVETVFSWPGLGYLTFQALDGPDLPLLQGTFVVFSSIVVLMNFVADLLYRVLDPRLKVA